MRLISLVLASLFFCSIVIAGSSSTTTTDFIVIDPVADSVDLENSRDVYRDGALEVNPILNGIGILISVIIVILVVRKLFVLHGKKPKSSPVRKSRRKKK